MICCQTAVEVTANFCLTPGVHLIEVHPFRLWVQELPGAVKVVRSADIKDLGKIVDGAGRLERFHGLRPHQAGHSQGGNKQKRQDFDCSGAKGHRKLLYWRGVPAAVMAGKFASLGKKRGDRRVSASHVCAWNAEADGDSERDGTPIPQRPSRCLGRAKLFTHGRQSWERERDDPRPSRPARRDLRAAGGARQSMVSSAGWQG